MADHEADQRDRAAEQARDEELDGLPQHDAAAAATTLPAERERAVADPVDDDRERHRDRLGPELAVSDVLGREHRGAQRVEHPDVDEEPDAADGQERDALAEQRAQPRRPDGGPQRGTPRPAHLDRAGRDALRHATPPGQRSARGGRPRVADGWAARRRPSA
ncbi:hypothetical protein GCM10025881_23430 [Pseudolysinimonas kribbensis]|uniref:Uncharacterized protein n=1 Tax=Pseudolysinimonas kribbensis TaxID=433641 RepID=A0ABQ6K579_9MICO|nr:hypothetical protein GCM10025881_23430 [Pseudolysinimonas kribbensis]